MRRAVLPFSRCRAAPLRLPAAPAAAMRNTRACHGRPGSARLTSRCGRPSVAGRLVRDRVAALRILTGSGLASAALSAAAFLALLAPQAALARACFQPDETQLESHQHYRSRGDACDVHGPARSRDGAKPAGASAQCRDGTWSFSHTRRGTCSRHGGVERWDSGGLTGPQLGDGARSRA